MNEEDIEREREIKMVRVLREKGKREAVRLEGREERS